MTRPKINTWVLLPVFLSLLLSAFVGLQLFQDGSSYLLEMLITHSAVRHGRLSILLFQFPTIFLIKTLHWLEIDPLVTLPIVRLAFNLNYALTPLASLLLSWMVVRKRREELLLWVALIVLFVNLVNFSWVSELLIAVQLAFPMLLALLQNPGSKAYWLLVICLTPFLFFLHPLAITIYLVFAAVSVYVGYRKPVYKRAATASAALFLLAAIGRGIYSIFTLNLYEVSFAVSGEISGYFVISRLENILFLGTAVEIAILVLLSHSIVHARWRIVQVVPWLIGLQSFIFVLLAAQFLFRENLYPLYAIGCLGIPAAVRLWQLQTNTPVQSMRRLYLACVFLAVASSSLLIAQYASAERQFTLKAGLDLFVALFIMLVAAIDSLREVSLHEQSLRFKLVFALSAVFACVITIKSVMWQTSVQKLEQTLQQESGPCTEITSTDFEWLKKSPYTILDNWAVPSLALVVQDERPRRALLAENDCQVFYESERVQVDPWSLIPKESIVPPLE